MRVGADTQEIAYRLTRDMPRQTKFHLPYIAQTGRAITARASQAIHGRGAGLPIIRQASLPRR